MKKYKVLNVKCGGCAGTLKDKLKPDFGDVEVDLEQMPRVITISQNNFDEKLLREKLVSMGYPMEDEELSTIQNITTKANSFVSCAIGKVNS